MNDPSMLSGLFVSVPTFRVLQGRSFFEESVENTFAIGTRVPSGVFLVVVLILLS